MYLLKLDLGLLAAAFKDGKIDTMAGPAPDGEYDRPGQERNRGWTFALLLRESMF